MLLTLSKPPKTDFEYKPHDYSPPLYSAPARSSPRFSGGSLHPAHSPPTFTARASSTTMGTPHRGLPPPSAMTLPDPSRGPPPPLPPPLSSIPQSSSAQWQSSEDSLKETLIARAEEERRKQEEEKTKQESLRLEQRKIEQSILRESMQGGVPPHLVPMIFTGIGGGNLGNISLEWLQQYVAQLQAAVQQQQQQQQPQQQQHQPPSQSVPQPPVSPELRRETRLISQAQPNVYGVAPPTPQQVLPAAPVLPGQPLAAQPLHAAFSTTSYPSGSMSPRARAGQTSGHAPPMAPASVQQLQQPHQAPQEQSSPSIYFHHWVPPTSQEKSSSSHAPATPAGKDKAPSSFSARPRTSSLASDLDYSSSPKKRKAQGGHQAAPPPTSAPQYTSPSYSHISSSSQSTPARRGHARTRSDLSARAVESHGGPVTRRGTISSHGPGEGSMSQQRTEPAPHGTEQQHYQQPQPGTEGQAPQSQQQQQHAQYHPQHPPPPPVAHPLQQQLYQHSEPHQQRNEGLYHGQQARAGASMAIQGETRQSQHQQEMAGPPRGSVPSSPKREAGGR